MNREHYMRLQPEPFDKIRCGTKRIEVRLYDEKRQQIQKGDLITFALSDDETKSVQVKVTDLVRFNTFSELFRAHDPVLYGSTSQDEYKSMYQYYSPADEQKYGVLAIWLELI
ncbi:MAG: ASCH domain-containing protein [Candidatus Pacebacteria bacterium]|nr:ASCH domain-containing protein [Candidatus Paceibacterota bacterium]